MLPSVSNTNKSICFPQLTSLTLSQVDINIDTLESFLLLTPSLAHLKMIGNMNSLDGTRWEQFIQIRLPKLNQFQIFLRTRQLLLKSSQGAERIIKPFRSRFWIEHKQWFFTLECESQSSNTYFYSLPMCHTGMNYITSPRKISLSTSASNSSTMYNVKNLMLTMIEDLADELTKKIAQWIVENTTGSTYRKHADFVQVWLGKNKIESSEADVACKRLKMSCDDIY
ncbi:unnamed protein product [Adineta ricciae]|uniref:Uncharacterized protein n=1 Tax=Adineta ricciae TaxID=249248 RepID=A0A815R3S8_ADIRI|nr:unnamed protein product [Adineta ricciae]CAF1472054.1 unnamed protein product [Adineta ricciae]